MTDTTLQHHLQAIAHAGDAGLLMPAGPTAEQRALLSQDLAYVPVTFGSLLRNNERLRLTSKGTRRLKELSAPPPAPEPAPPAPAPDPEPEPEPEPEPVPEPEPEPEPVPEPEPEPEPVPAPEPPAPAPPEPEAPPRTEAHTAELHAAVQAKVRELTETAQGMEQLAAALQPMATELHHLGLVPPGAQRQRLGLTRRNATTWARLPGKYALQGVDE